jgi:hypothetical protein
MIIKQIIASGSANGALRASGLRWIKLRRFGWPILQLTAARPDGDRQEQRANLYGQRAQLTALAKLLLAQEGVEHAALDAWLHPAAADAPASTVGAVAHQHPA